MAPGAHHGSVGYVIAVLVAVVLVGAAAIAWKAAMRLAGLVLDAVAERRRHAAPVSPVLLLGVQVEPGQAPPPGSLVVGTMAWTLVPSGSGVAPRLGGADGGAAGDGADLRR